MSAEGKVHDVREEELDNRGAEGPKLAADETKTGEEDHEVLWERKAHIKHFDEGENQWKERGTGDARIIKHRRTGKVLVLLREAIGKLAVNHHRVKGMAVVQVNKDKRFAMFVAPKDYSDEEGRKEKFLICFDTEEICSDFVKRFNGIPI